MGRESGIVFDKFNDGVRFASIGTSAVFALLFASVSIWLLAILFSSIAVACFYTRYRLTLFPSDGSARLERKIAGIGEDVALSMDALDHIEVDFRDGVGENGSSTVYKASLVFKEPGLVSYSLLTGYGLEDVVDSLRSLTRDFPIPVRFSEGFQRFRQNLEHLSMISETAEPPSLENK